MLAKRLRVLQTFTREPDEMDMHFIGLVLVIGTIGMLNLRVFGKQVPISPLNRLVPWGIAGFGMNVVTGLLAFISMPTFYPRHSVRSQDRCHIAGCDSDGVVLSDPRFPPL